jgi:mannose-6-phosphate isomerase-like protein (cupin superfamily)
MDAFELARLAAQQQASGRPYLEFFRTSALSLGLYVLPAGGDDRQIAHTEDEVYYVAAGRGMVTVGAGEREVSPGSIVYVAARVAHRFHSITESLSLVVFFAPAEYSQVQD